MEYIYKPYIFVGAGLATLACVNNLIESDEKEISKNDILILEAMDYKGGRMKTHQPENLEIGASWLHDSLDNKVLDYMVEKDLITFEKTHFDDIHKSKKVVGYFDDNVKLLLFNGQSYTNNSKFRLEILLDEFEKYVENYFFQEENLQKDPSLKWIFLKYINERKHYFKASHSKKQLELLSLFVRYVETWHGISWENLSAKYAFMHSMGQNILCFGFYKFINYLSEGITINYNENVSSIVKRTNQYIINDKYVTENCIISVPQSCFNEIKFNDNLINQELKESYDKLHYGSLGKIIIELDKDFDLENTRLYHMGQIKPNDSVLIEKAMSDDGIESITTKSLIESYNTNEGNATLENFCDWPMLIVNHQSIISKPILLILTQEPVTSLLEKSFSISPNDIVPFLKPLIENIGKFLYKDPQHECKIKKVLISNWSQNKYQKGSYPACHPNDDPLDVTIQTTLQNECSKLKIIGEYTNLEGCGSLNGAWLSGIECADTIKNQN